MKSGLSTMPGPAKEATLATLLELAPTKAEELNFSDRSRLLLQPTDPDVWSRFNDLQRLTLSNCDITSSQLQGLLSFLHGSSLKKLDVSRNAGILETKKTTIPDSLWLSMESLEELILAECEITALQLAFFMENWPPLTVKKLDLSDNEGILNTDPQNAPDWLYMNSLEELSLKNCNITPGQLRMFLKCSPPTTIEKLDLSNNIGILEANPGTVPEWLHMASLEEVSLAKCSLTADQLEVFLDCCAPRMTIKTFDLSRNPGLFEGASDILGWHHCECLDVVNIVGCKIESEHLQHLVKSLPKTVAHVDLDEEMVDAAARAVLVSCGFRKVGGAASGWLRPVQRRPVKKVCFPWGGLALWKSKSLSKVLSPR